jgi:hypothetical protein
MLLVYKLNAEKQSSPAGSRWTLVLPPFIVLRHWPRLFTSSLIFDSERGRNTITILWKDLFDLEAMNRYIPVMEYHDFVKTVVL